VNTFHSPLRSDSFQRYRDTRTMLSTNKRQQVGRLPLHSMNLDDFDAGIL
jgi:hypothetical protein